MRMIDPTYLRIINDGLYSGTLHKDNASALPIGLLGIYEEALPPECNVNERKKFLEFFAVWALLKKEVSADFVVPLLEGWTEETVLDYIAQYSKWFNSPVSEKFVIYHNRLRGFILGRITNIVGRNDILLNRLLLKESKEINSENEVKKYLQEYYGDHLAISSYFKGDGDDAYMRLKTVDQFIHERKWVIKDLDLMRWNETSAILASMEVDVPFLKQIVLSQDCIINNKLNIEYLLKQVIACDFKAIDELLIYNPNVLEKHLLIFALIFAFKDVLDNKDSDQLEIDGVLNGLIKRLNSLQSNNIWIIPEEIADKLDIELQVIAIERELEIELINTSKYATHGYGELPDRNIKGEQSSLEEHYLNVDWFKDVVNMNDDRFEGLIKNTLNKFIEDDIRPYVNKDILILDRIQQNIAHYRIVDDSNGDIITNILLSIKEATELTGSTDPTDYFDDEVRQVIMLFMWRDVRYVSSKWLSCFSSSDYWLETFKYYKALSMIYHKKEFQDEFVLSESWDSKDQLFITVLAAANVLTFKGENERAFEFYKRGVNAYLNGSLFDQKTIIYSQHLLNNKITKAEKKELIRLFREYEFRHVPTMSFCLCKAEGVLDLMTILNYDKTYLGGVSEHKKWINEILLGITSALGIEGSKNYILKGFDEYVAAMGKYSNYSDYAENEQLENIWNIEWWQIGNLVYGFHQLAENNCLDTTLDYASDHFGGEFKYFDDDQYYTEIEHIFMKYGYDPEDNLYAAIDDYKEIKPDTLEETAADTLFEYRLNPLKSLLRFNKISQNRVHVNCLASAINSEN